ncbi:uncharacterized protein LOC131937545 isoform X2 [Physella acuta]|uniref:uncharacterized protein LOC131937545 isoform X2 n=1 Tax=Physella acuta TaxID=109671 RepID=UPI0027DB4EA3|nr:uncharacterized protein LOC131937545 isoform X2 [Physella acuta]
MLGFFVFLGLAVVTHCFEQQDVDHIDLNGKTCTSNSDCEPDECCQKLIENQMSSRKRAAEVPGQRSTLKNKTGTCQKYKLDGDVCFIVDVTNGYCGCKPGSTCQQAKSNKSRNPRMVAFPDDYYEWLNVCRVESEAEVKLCSSDSECLPDECCQNPNKVQLASRKREATRVLATVATMTKLGTCQKYTRPGEFCDQFAKINGFCGCQSGTGCTGREVPATAPGSGKVPVEAAGTRGSTAPGSGKVPVDYSRSRRDLMPSRPGYVWEYTCTSISPAEGGV